MTAVITQEEKNEMYPIIIGSDVFKGLTAEEIDAVATLMVRQYKRGQDGVPIRMQ